MHNCCSLGVRPGTHNRGITTNLRDQRVLSVGKAIRERSGTKRQASLDESVGGEQSEVRLARLYSRVYGDPLQGALCFLQKRVQQETK